MKRLWGIARWPLVVVLLVANVYVATDLYENYTEENVIVTKLENKRAIWTEIIHPTVRIGVKGPTFGSRGSGVVIYNELNKDGSGYDTYVITCIHLFCREWKLVKGLTIQVEIYNPHTNEYETVEATMVESSVDLDLALLRLVSKNVYYTAHFATPREFNAISLFDDVYTVGSIFGEEIYPMPCQITKEPMGKDGRISGPIFPGYSGGGTYLANGHGLIGLNQSIGVYRAEMIPTVACFIPINVITTWLDELDRTYLYTDVEMEKSC